MLVGWLKEKKEKLHREIEIRRMKKALKRQSLKWEKKK